MDGSSLERVISRDGWIKWLMVKGESSLQCSRDEGSRKRWGWCKMYVANAEACEMNFVSAKCLMR